MSILILNRVIQPFSCELHAKLKPVKVSKQLRLCKGEYCLDEIGCGNRG